ncbi:hypothetical protein ERY430_80369 [Erythrobacter sp. EC-HK427]|nr:hypothetical protein ERY430_80369 [Erythrobacter sp. EC-HK427]
MGEEGANGLHETRLAPSGSL